LGIARRVAGLGVLSGRGLLYFLALG
jgi:hypothetical protein